MKERIIFYGIGGTEDLTAEEMATEDYSPDLFLYRYNNGKKAENLPELDYYIREIKNLLKNSKMPKTIEQLSNELDIRPRLVQMVIDYLVAHTGEVAALDLNKRFSHYLWADVVLAEEIRKKFTVGSVYINPRKYTKEDIAAVAAYITSMLLMKPSINKLNKMVSKMEKMITICKLASKFQPHVDYSIKLGLLEKKLELLKKRRDQEIMKWEKPGKAKEKEKKKKSVSEPVKKKYYGKIVYLLGSDFSYKGADKEERFNLGDERLLEYDFNKVTKLVVEIDSFNIELTKDKNFHIGDHIKKLKKYFKNINLQIVYRKVKKLRYPTKTLEKRFHKEVMDIINAGGEVKYL